MWNICYNRGYKFNYFAKFSVTTSFEDVPGNAGNYLQKSLEFKPCVFIFKWLLIQCSNYSFMRFDIVKQILSVIVKIDFFICFCDTNNFYLKFIFLGPFF